MLKNTSFITKLLYLLALIIFIAWIIPTMNTYYSNINTYKENKEKLNNLAIKHSLSTETQKFSTKVFKQKSELLFSKVEIKDIGEKIYEVHITMKKEDLKSFHTFIETISLRYYVEITKELELTTEDEVITAKMILKAF